MLPAKNKRSPRSSGAGSAIRFRDCLLGYRAGEDKAKASVFILVRRLSVDAKGRAAPVVGVAEAATTINTFGA